MPEPDFVLNEPLLWIAKSQLNGQTTKRMVAFRGMQNNYCVVAFGLKADGTGQEQLFSVQPNELSRPVTPTHIPAVIRPPEPPPIPLAERRASLLAAWQSHEEATNAVE